MKKILSIMLVATVIVLGGYFYFEKNLPTGQDKLTQIKISQTQSNAAETSDEEEISVAVEYLDKFKGPYKCSYNIAINKNLKTEARLFVAKGLVREIFTQIVIDFILLIF